MIVLRDIMSHSAVSPSVPLKVLIDKVGPLIFAPLSRFYGRPLLLDLSLIIFTLGSIGIGLSKNVAQLAATLIIQAMGSFTAWSLGTTVVSDMYKPEERGKGIALYIDQRR